MRSIACVFVVFVLTTPLPVWGSVFTVTTDADSGPGSLREAITLANSSAGSHTINFAADYSITLSSTLPTIESTITLDIQGNGWDRTVINGGVAPGGPGGVAAFIVEGTLILDGVGLQYCFDLWNGGAVTVNLGGAFQFLNSRAEANTSGFYGGAVLGEGEVTIEDSLMLDNIAYQGGAIYLYGVASIDRTTLMNNIATDLGGGAVTNQGGELTVSRSLFWANQSWSRGGGGIQTWAAQGVTVVENCTFVGNSGTDGGAISCEYEGGAALRGVTLTGNEGVNGGGINCAGAEIEGSIIFQNAASFAPDIFGTVTSAGYNIIGDVTGATIGGVTTGNQIAVDPLLNSLADNGGSTMTCALQVGSPAIDAGPPACAGLTDDQRSVGRPMDGDANGIAECDIGAFESGWIFGDGFELGDMTAWSTVAP